jgi:hypothetical protein
MPLGKVYGKVTGAAGAEDGAVVAEVLLDGLDVPAGDAATEAEHAEVKMSAPTIPVAAMILREFTICPWKN